MDVLPFNGKNKMQDCYPNERLIANRNITKETKADIEKCYESIRFLNEVSKTVPQDQLKNIVVLIESVEYTLQRLWGFEQNSDFHTHWRSLDICTCPKLDNDDRIGTKYRVIFGDCPLHSVPNESVGNSLNT